MATAITRSFAAVLVVLAAASLGNAQVLDSLALTYDDGNGNTMPYRLYLPPDWDAPGASYPLVVHLHGAGERGTNNTSQLLYIGGLIEEVRTDNPSFLMVPQAAPGERWDALGSPDLSLSGRLVTEIIASLETQYQIDTTQRYATGLSLGGFGTWDLIGKRPDLFAKAFPLSGFGDPAKANEYLDTEIWTFHGNGDTVVPVVPKRETVDAIRIAGGDPLYSEVNGGHGIWTPIYDDPIGELYDWVFDGVQPQLADFQYDPATGTVRIDASQAPGGSIDIFSFAVNRLDVLTVPDTVFVDGIAVPSDEFFLSTNRISIDYNKRTEGGFDGVVEIPGLLPAGLDFLGLSDITSRQFYFSPQTGDNRRAFNLIAIPEPTGVLLTLVGFGAIAGLKRC
ncbi:MAG: alpha/beta hydrolase-fold protein [Planctomycetota bacterium]